MIEISIVDLVPVYYLKDTCLLLISNKIKRHDKNKQKSTLLVIKSL